MSSSSWRFLAGMTDAIKVYLGGSQTSSNCTRKETRKLGNCGSNGSRAVLGREVWLVAVSAFLPLRALGNSSASLVPLPVKLIFLFKKFFLSSLSRFFPHSNTLVLNISAFYTFIMLSLYLFLSFSFFSCPISLSLTLLFCLFL